MKKKHSFKLINGTRGMFTNEEIDMVLYFESKGYRVNGIKTKETGTIVVTWSDGSESEYLALDVEKLI